MLVGSVIGHLAVPDMAAYMLSKWGVRGLVRQLRVDNRDRPGIRFGYVAPGGVDTPIYGRPRPTATPADAALPGHDPRGGSRRRALDVAARTSRGGQVGLANNLMRVGFSTLPWAYDRPWDRSSRSPRRTRSRPWCGGPATCWHPRRQERLRGEQGSALLGLARNLVALGRRRGGDDA